MGLQGDGKILLGGNSFKPLVRLTNTDPATQTLGYAGSTITWMRGGTGPEVWRSTFERSTDGLTWTSLGSGTRIPGGWQLTGVSLPTNGTLRARGYVAGGYRNASGWFVETIFDLTPNIRLSLARDGSMLVLYWTGGQGPYQVQHSTHVSDPNSWENLGAPMTTNSLTLPIGTGNQFLRVRSQ